MLRLVVADEKPEGTLMDLQYLACDFIHFCLIRGAPNKGEAMVTYSVEKLVVNDAKTVLKVDFVFQASQQRTSSP